jgi:hypothetical protein
MKNRVRSVLLLVLLPWAIVTWACDHQNPNQPSGSGGSGGSGSSGGSGQPAYEVASFVSDVKSTSGAVGTQRPGAAPQPTNGPNVTPTGNNGAINGGSNQVDLKSSSAFQTVYMFVGGVTGNVNGHWQVALPAATTSTSLIVSFGTQIPVSTFDLAFGVASPSGSVGPYSSIQIQKLAASTGEVQVSVSWDARSDVDLHVAEPSGEEIYWGHTASASGGQLDLDSNASCQIDGKNNENIRWTRAPGGSYRVRVDYWSACSVAQTNYIVTVRNGGSTQTFTGSFTGQGDEGGSGSGRLITTFTHAATLTDTEAPPVVEGIFPMTAVKRARSAAHGIVGGGGK